MMEDSIDSFIRFIAVERGLSENYQLSTHRSLSDFAHWCAARKKINHPRAVTLAVLSEYLADRKRAGLSASSIKLIVVALKIFFRFLAGKGTIERDPADALALPRIERYLPETLNELQVEQFLESIDTKAVHGLRDRAMIEYDRLYPGWGFADHKGYATPSHRAAIRRLGPSPIHRTSWAPFRVSELAGLQS